MSEHLRYILQKYSEGKITLKEDIELSEYLADKKNDAVEKILHKEWQSELNTDNDNHVNLKSVLDRIHHKIRLNEDGKNVPLNWWRSFQRVAAMLIVPLMISFLAYYFIQTKESASKEAYAEILCPMGVRTKFILPDGTTGFLNSGSTLKYPIGFKHDRNVTLVGEAYFDVRPDKEHPFIVKTVNLTSKVLGTQFNVIAYENENSEEIILQEGKVDVYSSRGEKLESLRPDQKLVLDTETRKYHKNAVEAGQYVSWTEGKLVFRNENMQQVADRLGRWYNVDIEIKDPELLKYAFRATFIDEPLEEVLKLLALTAPLTFEEQERETTHDDIYIKKKVIVGIDKNRLKAF